MSRASLAKTVMGDWNHRSDCALNSAPAYAPGLCDCGNTHSQAFRRIRNFLHFIYWRAAYHMGMT